MGALPNLNRIYIGTILHYSDLILALVGAGLQWGPQTGTPPKSIVRMYQEYLDCGNYIPIIFLPYFWGSLFWVLIWVLLGGSFLTSDSLLIQKP